MAVCKKCGANIYFIQMRSGRFNPVDTALRNLIPDETGKDIIITEDGTLKRGRLVGMEDGPHTVGFIPHWATCPFADSFKRKN